MKRSFIIIVFLSFLFGLNLFAQKKALPIYSAATKDKAYIIVINAPEDMESFTVSRKGPRENDYLRITKIPIGPIVDPSVVRKVLGEDYKWIVRALRASDDFEVTRRLQAEKGISAVLSLASLNAAKAAGRLFVDEKVEQGEVYSYKITFLNYEGKILAEEYRDIKIINNLPNPPTSIACEAGDQKVELKWNYPNYMGDEDDIVVGFNLYRKYSNNNFEKINKVLIMRQDELKERTDFSVKNNIEYSYYMTAVDCIGRESQRSETVITKPRDLTPPAYPQGLRVHEEDGFILLSWNMNLELDLSHYDIFKSLDVHSGYEKINDLPLNAELSSYKDTNVYFGPTYYYKIKAIDESGNESELSNIISGKPIDSKPPGIPSDVKFTIENNHINLSWIAPNDRDLQGYYIYRRRSDLEFLRIVNLPLDKDTLNFIDKGYSEKGLWQGQTYFYAISALDNFFNESEKNIIEIQIPDNEPPGMPVTSYASSTADGLVEINWQPSMSLDVTNYRIYRFRENEFARMIIETSDSIYGIIDSTAERGILQYYRVVAVDMSGNESDSTKTLSVIPRDTNPPLAPQNVNAIVQTSGVQISWEHTGEIDLLGYNIYRSDIPNGIPIKINTRPIKNNKYSDPSGSEGLYYKVSSLDTSMHENNSGEAVEAISEK